MVKMRLNSEKTIKNPNFSLKIGTIDRLNPKAIYLEGKTFVCPQYDDEDYSRIMNGIRSGFKRDISNALSFDKTPFSSVFILDFDIASSRMKKGKKSFLSFQITMRQKDFDNLLSLKEIKEKSEDMFTSLLCQLEDRIVSNSFAVSKTK
jgi:hypothetical protein